MPDGSEKATIKWAVKTCKEFGRRVATAKEAREMLKVGVWYDSVDETLFKLGMAPNRSEGQTGFLTYETDGKIPKANALLTSPVSVL